mmetsp:Transcript_18172/g.49867  ORF Transcript_18172/g.49867 Transcript_18172/m.49867 type:complete len:81 (+) Transcript_18172:470-712(+)
MMQIYLVTIKVLLLFLLIQKLLPRVEGVEMEPLQAPKVNLMLSVSTNDSTMIRTSTTNLSSIVTLKQMRNFNRFPPHPIL